MHVCVYECKQMTAAEQMNSDALYSRYCNRLITKGKIFHVYVKVQTSFLSPIVPVPSSFHFLFKNFS